MLGSQSTAITWKVFYELCDTIGYTLKPIFPDWVMEEDKKRKDVINSYDMFLLMGFEKINSLDVNENEGADIIFDLQSEYCPEYLRESYDFIYDGGTLEHVFHIPNALDNIHKILKKGGTVIHDVALANWVDHGYYSFSPILFRDHYNSRHYHINSMFMFGYGNGIQSQEISPDCRFIDCQKWISECVKDRNVLLVCIATKPSTDFEKKTLLQEDCQSDNMECFLDSANRSRRIKMLINLIAQNEIRSPIAIYGIGETQQHIIAELARNGLVNKVHCIYDRDAETQGMKLESYRCKIPVLDINRIQEDNICTVVIASFSRHAEEIYERIRYLEEQGIQIIRLQKMKLEPKYKYIK